MFSCPEEYRKINDPAQKREALGPIIANCLRAKFVEYTGQVHLNPRCKDEVIIYHFIATYKTLFLLLTLCLGSKTNPGSRI